MKKLILFSIPFYLVPLMAKSQFREKNGSNSPGNINSNTNTSKNKPKPIDTAKSKFNGDYDAPEAFSASFHDGSSIDYTLSHRNPDEVARLSVFFPANFSMAFPQGNPQVFEIDELGASYYFPGRFYAEGNYGFSSSTSPSDWDVTALIFIKKWGKKATQRITLKSVHNTDYESPYVDMPKKEYFGIHLGYGDRTFGTVNAALDNYAFQQNYTPYAPEIVAGVGFLGVDHYTLFTSVQNKTRTHTHQNGFYIDALYAPSATAADLTLINNGYPSYLPIPHSYYNVTLKTTLGARMYWEFKWASTSGSYEWGEIFKGGYGITEFKQYYVMIDFGLYFKII